MATGDRTMDSEAASPESAGDDDAEVQTQRMKAAVPPRPVTLPPRPSGPGSLTPSNLPRTRLSDGPPRSSTNGQAAVPPAPRLPAGPPPLPPPGGPLSVRSRALANPPPLPQRSSTPPPPPLRSPSATPPPPPVAPSLAARFAEEKARAERLQSRVDELQQVLSVRSTELDKTRAECSRLRTELAEREADRQHVRALAATETELRARIADLERTSADLSSRLAESEVGLGRAETRVHELEQELTIARVRIAADAAPGPFAVEPMLAKAPAPIAPAPAASGPVQVSPEDNLKKIRGIGPKFERALKAAGVRTFAQIAALGEQGIADLARTLRISADRIRRERWVERAQELRATAEQGRPSRSSG
jgi:predicted flap endonuclease-1-like 5' DNA nuclease